MTRVSGCAYHALACVQLSRDARERAGVRVRGGRHSDMRVGKYPVPFSRGTLPQKRNGMKRSKGTTETLVFF